MRITAKSRVSAEELQKRYNRLDRLRVITEPFESGPGLSIYKKALRAEDAQNFTGIIRLTPAEKDWLEYLLENDMLTDYDVEVINFYIR